MFVHHLLIGSNLFLDYLLLVKFLITETIVKFQISQLLQRTCKWKKSLLIIALLTGLLQRMMEAAQLQVMEY